LRSVLPHSSRIQLKTNVVGTKINVLGENIVNEGANVNLPIIKNKHLNFLKEKMILLESGVARSLGSSRGRLRFNPDAPLIIEQSID